MFQNVKVPLSVLKTVLNLQKRCASKKISVTRYGEPLDVLTIEEDEIVAPKSEEVLVKILAAPVNPVDINIVQGKYNVKFPVPFVAGYEGVGQVLETGKGVESLKKGDHVVLLKPCVGTWRTHITISENLLLKVPKELGLNDAATLICNSSTAYSMLKSFTDLSPGDVVIQNGGNSACGQLVIQLCKLWGINSVNVVRNRPEIEDLRNYLKTFGATYVLTEEELRKTDLFKSGKLPKPKLALNCIGGKIATEIGRYLQPKGYHITYGGMSMEPVTIPTSSLIFSDIRVRGFNMTGWIENESNKEKRKIMLNELVDFSLSEKLVIPKCTQVKYTDYTEAIEKTHGVSKGLVREKYILRFD